MERPEDLIRNMIHNWPVKLIENYFRDNTANEGLRFTVIQRWAKKKQLRSRDKLALLFLIKQGGCEKRKFFLHGLIKTLAAKKESSLVIELLHYVTDIDAFLVISEPVASCSRRFQREYRTPLHLAVTYGLEEVVEYLISQRKCDVNKLSERCLLTALHISVCEGNSLEILRMLLRAGAMLEAKDYFTLTPLMYAMKQENLEVAKFLLEHNANPHAKTKHGFSILHIYCGDSNAARPEDIEFLLNIGCDPNAQSTLNFVPLHELAKNRRLGTKAKIDATNALMKHGASLNTTTGDNFTVLHISAGFCPNDIAFIVFLLEKGAVITQSGRCEHTFLDILDFYSYPRALLLVKYLTLEAFKGKFNFCNNLLHTLNSNAELLEYKGLCEEDLEGLKKQTCFETFSLFDILITKERKIARYYENPDFITGVCNFDEGNFQIYGIDIREKFQEALKLKESEYTCIEFFHRYIKIGDPEIRHILSHFDNKEIKEVAETLRVLLGSPIEL